MQIETLAREFSYNGAKLADPAPAFTLQQVRDFYSQTYPELTNAEIEGPVIKANRNVYTFRRAVGTKGNSGPDQCARIFVTSSGAEGKIYITGTGVGIHIGRPADSDDACQKLDEIRATDCTIPPPVRAYLAELDRFSTAHVCPLLVEEVAFINALHARYCTQPK
ncbi:PRTRC system protein C [Burkholderia cepacia]|uniref:PRTRC system protein C n=1 Tax=Burkholderia cepacia complex TaxID=87882 RepID=UPI0007C80B49|nr:MULTISPECIES: PRTRC system protein C [Burkholderia cepacia complex]NTX44202.1 PRTRC system protein C [Burkholderia cepacia]